MLLCWNFLHETGSCSWHIICCFISTAGRLEKRTYFSVSSVQQFGVKGRLEKRTYFSVSSVQQFDVKKSGIMNQSGGLLHTLFIFLMAKTPACIKKRENSQYQVGSACINNRGTSNNKSTISESWRIQVEQVSIKSYDQFPITTFTVILLVRLCEKTIERVIGDMYSIVNEVGNKASNDTLGTSACSKV